MFLFTIFFGLGYGISTFVRSQDTGFKAWLQYTMKGFGVGFLIEIIFWAIIFSYLYV